MSDSHTLNIITPCSRTTYLRSIYHSIGASFFNLPHKINWHIVLDKHVKYDKCPIKKCPEFRSISIILHQSLTKSYYGNCCRNIALDLINSGFIYFLDDDTLMHLNFGKYFQFFQPNSAYTFLSEGLPFNVLRIIQWKANNFKIIDCNHSQIGPNYQSYATALENYQLLLNQPTFLSFLAPNYPLPSRIDSSMYCVCSSLVKETRWGDSNYRSDGVFISRIVESIGFENLKYVNKILGHYNFLNPNPKPMIYRE
tara:strand:- start:173 stop:934 length:762 start_codon:yes stop_codon:yes gene_type:complete